MIEFVIAYDERDDVLGSYFQECRNNLVSVISDLQELDPILNDVPANKCNRAYLDYVLANLRDKPFIIAVYCHGNPKQLVVNGSLFIDSDEDNEYFKKTFFYTNSCSSGKTLGPKLIEQNCSVFIGFERNVESLMGDYYEELSINCDNFGITAFLTQEITAFEAYEQMIKNYTQKIQNLQKTGDILRAGIFINAREALVFHGNKDLTKADLQIPLG